MHAAFLNETPERLHALDLTRPRRLVIHRQIDCFTIAADDGATIAHIDTVEHVAEEYAGGNDSATLHRRFFTTLVECLINLAVHAKERVLDDRTNPIFLLGIIIAIVA